MIDATLSRRFQELLGKENVLDREADRHAYSFDAAVLAPVTPALVLRPVNSEQLGRAVALCNENSLPVTVRGAGTNLSGGTIPDPGGVVLLTTGLNRIREINEADLYAVVEPGVITAAFAKEVERRGLFYPPDPGSQAVSTLGGNVAENAGGLRGLKYGVTGDYVMGVDFFAANGDLIRAGGRTVKLVTGLNLAQLMVGSEGTLGVFESITLKLVPPPRARQSMVAIYDDMNQASETVAAIIAEKIVPCTLEFLDNFTIRTVEAHARAGLPVDAQALLLIEVDGHPAQVEDEAAQVLEICRRFGARSVRLAKDEAERAAIWEARRAALPALSRLRPTTVLEDATVPRSQIPAMLRAVEDIARKHKLTVGVFGHAGDGNLHPTILTDKRDKEEWRRVEAAIEEMFERALALGGTLSGEHGIGLAKARFLVDELNPRTIDYSRRLKRALDPGGVLNPDKLMGREEA